MTSRTLVCIVVICAAVVLLSGVKSPAGDDPQGKKGGAKRKPEPTVRFTVEAAKERSELMHHIYAATLDTMHHHYFRVNKSVLPARAMEDVFADVAQQTHSTARWISVNTKPMSVDHEPSTDFERNAAAAIASGKTEFGAVEDGYYRRAGMIPLSAGCVGCHTGMATDPGKTPRFAALVISIPVQE
ncbi:MULTISPECIES: hypothetical protein [unclassified Schlesneria]|uniref:hypothetical protein n=1 Tax=Schlesneria TaxID=656899 RepID=UPI002F163D9A